MMSSSRLAFFIVIVSSFGCKDIVISLSEGKNNINVTTKTNHEQASTLPNVEEETTTEENLVGSAGAALQNNSEAIGNAVKGGAQAVGKALATGADTLGKAATGTINFVGGLLGKLG